ncbi:hypothetical protein CEXT_480321 [Caerostris extrusa]|uniref:Uncharacterized protein n=1 Tax=Caerostris extrusa TaxID=172846 RepID=A0AAV4XDL1_CAEEX|nr:hypothetical protein CEXT_480321 [Caerostris extrusa]
MQTERKGIIKTAPIRKSTSSPYLHDTAIQTIGSRIAYLFKTYSEKRNRKETSRSSPFMKMLGAVNVHSCANRSHTHTCIF